MKKTSLFLFIILLGLCAYAQTPASQLIITIRMGNGFGKFFTTATRDGDQLKIVYSNRDSISLGYLKDPSYAGIYNILQHKPGTVSEESRAGALRSFIKLVDHYSFFSKDSVTINLARHKPLADLLIKVDNSTVEELEGKKRPVLDGTPHVYEFKGAGGIKRIEVTSPGKESHPILYQLMIELLKLRVG